MKTIKSIFEQTLFESKNAQTVKELLEEAVKQNSVLRGADLTNSDLRGADLTNSDLTNSDLRGAGLINSDLRHADLTNSDLRHADLRHADLTNSDLRGADLTNSDLRHADLRGADLRGAVLRGADLRGAVLEVDKIKHLFQIVPEEGSFIAWKKGENDYIIKLLIPANAKRHNHLAGRKCRAEFVDVLNIFDNKGNETNECQNGTNDNRVTYKVGKRTYADSYDPDPRVNCSNGIHFFLTRKEAEEW
jgi:hypothetical protein